jgi:hypothetical protein
MPIIINGVIIGTRFADDFGAVPVTGKGGDDLANAFKKAATQAHRRATLTLLGIGMNDETEVEQIKGAVVIQPEEMANLGTALRTGSVQEVKALPAPTPVAPAAPKSSVPKTDEVNKPN